MLPSQILTKSNSIVLNRSAKNTEQFLEFNLQLLNELLNYLEPENTDKREDDSEESEEEKEFDLESFITKWSANLVDMSQWTCCKIKK